MNKLRLLILLFIGTAIQAQDYSKLPTPLQYHVTVQNNVWSVTTPSHPIPMVFNQEQIAHIINSMPSDRAGLVLANGIESMGLLIAYIDEQNIRPDFGILHATFSNDSQQQVTQRFEYQVIMH